MIDLSNGVLERLGEDHWILRDPEHGGLINSTHISFLPGPRIAVYGDLCPCKHGVISALGYGLPWFSRPKGASYLGEKFLPVVWTWERAESELRWHIDNDEDDAETLNKFREALGDDECDARQLYEALEGTGYEDELPGYGYDPRDERLLQAIQHRFAAAYTAMHAEEG